MLNKALGVTGLGLSCYPWPCASLKKCQIYKAISKYILAEIRFSHRQNLIASHQARSEPSRSAKAHVVCFELNGKSHPWPYPEEDRSLQLQDLLSEPLGHPWGAAWEHQGKELGLHWLSLPYTY